MTKKTYAGTPLTERETLVLAACFAVTNMGQAAPDRRVVADMLSAKAMSLSGAVMQTAHEYMETDDHQRMFEDECRGWHDRLRGKSREYVASTWPNVARLVWPEPATSTFKSSAQLEAEKSGYTVAAIREGYMVGHASKIVVLPLYERETSAWIAASAYERGLSVGADQGLRRRVD